MVDAQRNVIISLKLAGVPKNQRVANEVAGQAQSAADAAAAVYRSSLKQFERTESGKSKISKNESQKRIDQYAREMDEYEKRRKAFSKRYEELEKRRTESTQKANEAAVVAVQGMADMVEGAAKLGLISEENFEKYAKSSERIQEGIRVFKGATDVWFKGREALIALSEATHAQTAANNLLALSNARAASSQVAGAAVAGRAGSGVASTAGVVGAHHLIGKGGGAAGGGIRGTAATVQASAIHGAGVAGVLAAKVAALGGVALAATEGIQLLRRGMGDTSKNAESFVGALRGWYKASQQLEESTKRVTKAEETRQRLLESRKTYFEQESGRVKLQKQLRGAGNIVSEARGIAAGETNLGRADRLRLEAVRELRAVELELAEDKIRQDERVSRRHLRSSELTLQLLQDREAAQKRVYDAEVNRLSIIRSENEAIRDQLKSEKERLGVLQKAKQTEEQSLDAKLGQLNPGLQSRVIEIAQKGQAGGELNRRDVAILQEAGIGQEQIRKYYAEQGRALQGSEAVRGFFGSSQLKEDLSVAGQSIEEKQKKLNQRLQSEQQAGQNLITTAQLLKQSVEARVNQEATIKNILLEEVKALNDNSQQIQQVASDASDGIRQQGMATIDAIRDLGDSMLSSLLDLKKQIDKIKLTDNGYKNP